MLGGTNLLASALHCLVMVELCFSSHGVVIPLDRKIIILRLHCLVLSPGELWLSPAVVLTKKIN